MSHSSGKFVGTPGGKNDFFASRALVPFTFGNPSRNGSGGGFFLSTHSNMCLHNTTALGHLPGQAHARSPDDSIANANPRAPLSTESTDELSPGSHCVARHV